MRSFLDGVNTKGCSLICHDANHNGDYDGTCGNPDCWKYNKETSTPPRPERQFNCRCPIGTFPNEKST